MRNNRTFSGESGYGTTDSEGGSPLRGHRFLDDSPNTTPARETTRLLHTISNGRRRSSASTSSSDSKRSNGKNYITSKLKSPLRISWRVPTTREEQEYANRLQGETKNRDSKTGTRLLSVIQDPYLPEDHPFMERKKITTPPIYCFVTVVLGVAISSTVGGLFYRHRYINNHNKGHNKDNNQNSILDPFEHIPFPSTTRSLVNLAASPLDIFDTTLLYSNTVNSDESSATIATSTTTTEMSKMPSSFTPFPTGAFWTNFVLKSATAKRDELSFPIVVNPYAFKWAEDRLALSYPSYRTIVQPLVVKDVFWPDISISCVGGFTKRKLMDDYGPMSVTVRMYSTDNSQNNSDNSNNNYYMESYLVQGSPYVTTYFQSTTPILTALSLWDDVRCLSHDKSLCEVTVSEPGNIDLALKLRGTQFLITQAEGQRWLLFVLSKIKNKPYTFKLTADRRSIIGVDEDGTSFSGVLRLAMLPPGAEVDGLVVNELIQHSGIYATKGRVLVNGIDGNSGKSSPSDVTTATVTFAYDVVKANTNNNNNVELLMLALPHHRHALALSEANIPLFDANYTCIKGPMTPVTGNRWNAYVEKLTDVLLDHPDGSLNDKTTITHPDAITAIQRSVNIDKSLITPTAQGVYGFGKEIARMAQLAYVASAIGMSEETVNEIVETVHTHLSKWLDGNGGDDEFLYDVDIGGVVTKRGLEDTNADFGNGWYNDHHFHYGYYIYAATLLSKFNPTFLDKYCSHIDSLIHDISNYKAKDKSNLSKYFPSARHKSWYDGHSWATGLYPQSNGKSQESSSEAINAYYATYLWHDMVLNQQQQQLASNNPILDEITTKKNHARLLLAMEIRATQTYWHTGPSNKLYPPNIADNYMIGNLGGLDATCTTWFGNKIVYVHLINVLPVTEITQVVFNEKYVEGEYKFLEEYVSSTEEAWKGYLSVLHAIVDPEAAWVEAQNLASYRLDTALSKSQILYWIATRPGLGSDWNITYDDASDASCDDNVGCSGLSLVGDCCPTTNGVYLGCCFPR